ncbi:MAG: TolC family protein [Bacteroidia bacterium]|nr:TolC family protein [Bacteroidia bacterium]
MNLKQLGLTLVLVTSHQLSNAQTAITTAFTLKEAQDYAIKNSVILSNSAIDMQIAQAKVKETMGMGLPQISGSFDVKDFLVIPTSLLPAQIFGGPAGSFIPVKFGTKYNATLGLSASQLIFSSDYLIGVQATKTYLELTQKSANVSNNDIKSNVAKAYYGVLVNKERLTLLTANIARIEKLLSDTKAFNKQGFVELIDVDRIEVLYNNLVSEKQKIEKLVTLTETVLKFQMNYDTQQPIQLTDKIEQGIDVSNIALSDVKLDVTNRPEYALLETNLKLNLLDLKRNRLSYLPTMVAYGAYSGNAQRSKFDVFKVGEPWFQTAIIGATINVPIFSGFQKHFKTQQAALNVMKTQNNMRNLQNGISLETQSSLTSYSNAVVSISNNKRNIDLAKNVYEVSKKKYDQGVGSNLEVTTAATALKEAETNYAVALYDYYIAKIDYEKATGTIK